MSKQMDEETFEANVLGMFKCFEDDAPILLGMPKTAAVSKDQAAADIQEAAASFLKKRQEMIEARKKAEAEAEAKLDRKAVLKELFDSMDSEGPPPPLYHPITTRVMRRHAHAPTRAHKHTHSHAHSRMRVRGHTHPRTCASACIHLYVNSHATHVHVHQQRERERERERERGREKGGRKRACDTARTRAAC